MRVIAGTARSLKLIVPNGKNVRPTLDRTKETLFNIIQSEILNCTFVDLFSGSGAIGIEALSRGAKKAYFVEKSHESLSCIEQNLNHTKLLSSAIVLKMDCEAAVELLAGQGVKADIIFLDPPYNKGYEEKIITKISEKDLLNKGGLVICESATGTSMEFAEQLKNLDVINVKEFKTSKFTFLRFG